MVVYSISLQRHIIGPNITLFEHADFKSAPMGNFMSQFVDRAAISKQHDDIDIQLIEQRPEILRPFFHSPTIIECTILIEQPVPAIEVNLEDLRARQGQIICQPPEERPETEVCCMSAPSGGRVSAARAAGSQESSAKIEEKSRTTVIKNPTNIALPSESSILR